MGAEVTYELNLEPAEDAAGWTAMVYRYVKAGVCGPWTETKPIEPHPVHGMFWPIDVLAEAGLRTLGLEREFEPGVPEAYGRYGSVALRVPLAHR
jgi:hypothetical protein